MFGAKIEEPDVAVCVPCNTRHRNADGAHRFVDTLSVAATVRATRSVTLLRTTDGGGAITTTNHWWRRHTECPTFYLVETPRQPPGLQLAPYVIQLGRNIVPEFLAQRRLALGPDTYVAGIIPALSEERKEPFTYGC